MRSYIRFWCWREDSGVPQFGRFRKLCGVSVFFVQAHALPVSARFLYSSLLCAAAQAPIRQSDVKTAYAWLRGTVKERVCPNMFHYLLLYCARPLPLISCSEMSESIGWERV